MNPNPHALDFSLHALPKRTPNQAKRTPNQAKRTTPKSSSSSSSSEQEIRVCTNRTCRKQGSSEVLQVLSGIAPPHVAVTSCGCLGKCGAGPNVVVLPEGVFVGHCGTPNKAARVMAHVCGVGVDDVESVGVKCLQALGLRKRAEDEMGRAEFALAHDLLSQAVDLKPFGGLHIIYKERSAVRLAMGDISGAFQDVKEALTIAPYYPEGYVCKGDVLMAVNEYDAAEESYSIALELDPSIRRSRSFKAKIAKLQEKLAPSSPS